MKGCEIKHGNILNKNLEPLKFIHSVLGLRGYEKFGTYFTDTSWITKAYLMFISCCTAFNIMHTAIYFFTKIRGHSFEYLVISYLVSTTSAMQSISFWMTNTLHSSSVIKMFKNFDFIESSLPNKNRFLHNCNIFNSCIHLYTSTFLVTLLFVHLFEMSHLSASIIYLNCVAVMNYITCILSLYQCCIMKSIISTYSNSLNNAICKLYQTPEYHGEHRDPLMFTMKRYMFLYTSVDKTETSDTNYSDVDLIKICYKLLYISELSNDRYNSTVSNEKL